MDLQTEIDACEWIFAREISEPRENVLRIVVQEATVSQVEEPIQVGRQTITGRRVRSNASHRMFEVLWERYIAYSVLNESFSTVDPEGTIRESGKRFRVYLKSSFLEHIERSSIATHEYPGPFKHYSLVCENHIIDVVAQDLPSIRQLHPVS
jgi:hypothetical protein